jgi:hypothetical protein
MKVLISKYEIRSIEERWPNFEDCPDFVEVTAVPLSVFDMTPQQKARLKNAIETHISKEQQRKSGRKQSTSKSSKR